MSLRRRILASRTNGAKSRGPVTAAGKKRSSTNSLRHGLLARCVVLEAESREGFDSLVAGFMERFNPADSVEFGFVEEMLSALWRQRRAWAIETRLMDDAVAAQPSESGGQRASIAAAFAALAAQPQLSLLHRYESRLHRVFQRALHNLLLLQAKTPPIQNCQTNLVPKSDTSETETDSPAHRRSEPEPACPDRPGLHVDGSGGDPGPADRIAARNDDSDPVRPRKLSTETLPTSGCQTNLVPKSDSAETGIDSVAKKPPA
jgi:hypothetical protein